MLVTIARHCCQAGGPDHLCWDIYLTVRLNLAYLVVTCLEGG